MDGPTNHHRWLCEECTKKEACIKELEATILALRQHLLLVCPCGLMLRGICPQDQEDFCREAWEAEEADRRYKAQKEAE